MLVFNKLEQLNKQLPQSQRHLRPMFPISSPVIWYLSLDTLTNKDRQHWLRKLRQDMTITEDKLSARAAAIDLPHRTTYGRWEPQPEQAHCQVNEPCQLYAQLFRGTPAHQGLLGIDVQIFCEKMRACPHNL